MRRAEREKMTRRRGAEPEGCVGSFSPSALGLFVAAAISVTGHGCGTGGAGSAPRLWVRLATTTSTENSGLLAAILGPFCDTYGIRVDVVAVGTGKALKLAENGDVDAVLVHAPEAERAFVAAGFGVCRRKVMYDAFILAGPPEDPAGIGGAVDVRDALARIASSRAPFVSRGDDSGTHKREIELWKLAGLEPAGPWYIETGQAMGATLVIAGQKRAYVLTDDATHAAFRRKTDLVALFAGAPELHNPYGVIAVNPARYPHTHHVEAMALIGWLTSAAGQRAIGSFRIDGESFFHPLALHADGRSRHGTGGFGG